MLTLMSYLTFGCFPLYSLDLNIAHNAKKTSKYNTQCKENT